MNQVDAVFVTVLALACSGVVVIGGLFHPNTVAGAIARFVFSCN